MFLPGTRIEIVNPDLPRGRFSAVLFDFDGTLSLVREGWPEVMIPMMVEILAESPQAEPREALSEHVEEFVMRLNGKQTIYQMIHLAEEVAKRGGTAKEPLEYKQQYHDLLWERVSGRVSGLKDGSVEAEILTVPGSRELLEQLQAAGCDLYLASGTDHQFVADELAAAASLVMGQAREACPVVLARGASLPEAAGGSQRLIRDKALDMFR